MGLSYLAFRSFLKLQTASSVDFQPFLKAGLYNIYSYIYIYLFIFIYIYIVITIIICYYYYYCFYHYVFFVCM